ncbi:hypothetical protein H632_c3531p0, partial [Helicosporidium sp. ATCC 50920]
RALEFDVFLPNWPTDAFTDLVRETFLADLANAVPGAEFLMRSVADGSRGVTPRLLVAFGENPNADWLATARGFYLQLRTGRLNAYLSPSTWGPTIVQQVTMPFLVGPGGFADEFITGTIVYGLQLNLHLEEHTFDWLTLDRARALLLPFVGQPGVVATNMWKHAYVPDVNGTSSVIATIQCAGFSSSQLQSIIGQIEGNTETIWPTDVWGRTTLMTNNLVVLLGGQVMPPSPPSPPTPPPPVSPTAPVVLSINGTAIFTATDEEIPVIVVASTRRRLLQTPQPSVDTTVDPRNYPYTGFPLVEQIDGAEVTSLYVQYRLVGFTVPKFQGSVTAMVDGVAYTV